MWWKLILVGGFYSTSDLVALRFMISREGYALV
jgi:hypothetical protein